MGLIDEKGKIFGLINYFDLGIVILIMALIGGLFVYMPQKNQIISIINDDQQQEIFITYFISGVRELSVNAINIGDEIRNTTNGRFIGVVEEKNVQNTRIMTTNRDGEVIYSEIPDRFDLTIRVRAKGVVTDTEIKIGNDVIKIGQTAAIDTRIIRTNGVIFGIEY